MAENVIEPVRLTASYSAVRVEIISFVVNDLNVVAIILSLYCSDESYRYIDPRSRINAGDANG